MPWSQTPKRPFRILVYLIVLATFGLFTRQLFSIITTKTTAPSPPPAVSHDGKANSASTTITSEAPPIPTIIANNVTDSVIEEDYWPQWNTWRKGFYYAHKKKLLFGLRFKHNYIYQNFINFL